MVAVGRAARGGAVEATLLWMPDGRPLRHMRWDGRDGCGVAVVHGHQEAQVLVLRTRPDGHGLTVEAGTLVPSVAYPDLLGTRVLAEGDLRCEGSPVRDVLGLEGCDLARGFVGHVMSDGERKAAFDATARAIAEAGAHVAARLGPRALEFLADREALTPTLLTTYGGGHATRLWRMQAVGLYPYLLEGLGGMPDVLDAIDRGRPFEPVLAARACEGGVRTSTIRRTRGVADPEHVPGATLALADRLPPDWIPRDGPSWDALRPLAAFLDGVSRRYGPDFRTLADTPVGGDLTALGVRLVGTDEPRWGNRSPYEAVQMRIKDTVAHVVSTLVWPMCLRAGLGDDVPRSALDRAAGVMLLEGRSILAVNDLVARHHAAVQRLEAELPTGRKPASWLPCITALRLEGGVEVVPLTTPAELRAEGGRGADVHGVRGLNHCVGTYAPACASGRTHILSVRVREGRTFRRLATANVSFERGVLRLRELSGASNERPPAEAVQAMEVLARMVAEGEVEVDPEVLRVAKDNRSDVVGTWGSLRYDPHDDTCITAAWDVWRPFMAPRHAAMDLDEAVEDLVATLSPGTAPAP